MGADAGAVYLFDANTGDLLQTFYGPNPHAGAEFGFSLADIDEDAFIVGAPSSSDANDPGMAYIIPIAPIISPVPGAAQVVNFAHIPSPPEPAAQFVEGAPEFARLTTFADPGALAGQHTDDATIDWGDKSPTTIGLIHLDASSGLYDVVGYHAYAHAGSYPITVTVDSSEAGTTIRFLVLQGSAQVIDAPIDANASQPSLSALPSVALGANPVAVAVFTDTGGGDARTPTRLDRLGRRPQQPEHHHRGGKPGDRLGKPHLRRQRPVHTECRADG